MWASPVAQRLKRLPGMQETQAGSLSWDDPLEKEMATHSSTLAWRIPWREGCTPQRSLPCCRDTHIAGPMCNFYSTWALSQLTSKPEVTDMQSVTGILLVRIQALRSFWVLHSLISTLNHLDTNTLVFLLSIYYQIRSFSQFSHPLMSKSLRPHESQQPGLPVHHQLLEFTQTHAHRVGDAIQPSHPLSSPSPPAPNTSQHQSLFQWVNSSHDVAKVLVSASASVLPMNP